ncbi:N-acetylneuraminate synthase [uncultured Ruegeria sp.]|uniref:N-acetylneuraminate synthase n=1 Tax=uncultured Ruegeria sp. TaxID=259304 RepID=UPI002622A171|nr:N-acetylneuraminate synthase [uncultured Ruegeria sp.]
MQHRKITLIAEAGVNHNGDLNKALALIDAAADAGADLIKFQTFSAKAMVAKTAALADYQAQQIGTGKTQLEMLLELELDEAAHHALIEKCSARGIGFLSTPFDLVSLELLTKGLGQRLLKIGSGDLNNGPLLYAAAKTGCEIILSTGMSDLGEIERALGLLALGYSTEPPVAPSRCDMREAWSDPQMRARLHGKVTILHCVSNYPSSPEATNLHTIATIRAAFGLPVGYSDHTLGGTASIAAAALGACCIEKHLTLDKSMDGPDHSASAEPDEIAGIFSAVRDVEAMLGSRVKCCTPEERSTMKAARKHLVAQSDIAKGRPFTLENLSTKRAAAGRDPLSYWEILGTLAKKDYNEGDPIDE